MRINRYDWSLELPAATNVEMRRKMAIQPMLACIGASRVDEAVIKDLDDASFNPKLWRHPMARLAVEKIIFNCETLYCQLLEDIDCFLQSKEVKEGSWDRYQVQDTWDVLDDRMTLLASRIKMVYGTSPNLESHQIPWDRMILAAFAIEFHHFVIWETKASCGPVWMMTGDRAAENEAEDVDEYDRQE